MLDVLKRGVIMEEILSNIGMLSIVFLALYIIWKLYEINIGKEACKSYRFDDDDDN